MEVINTPKPETFKKQLTSANILLVEAGTNTPQGGDASHGGRTVLQLIDEGSTHWSVSIDGQPPQTLGTLRVELGGDTEADTFMRALQWALQVYRFQRSQGAELVGHFE